MRCIAKINKHELIEFEAERMSEKTRYRLMRIRLSLLLKIRLA